MSGSAGPSSPTAPPADKDADWVRYTRRVAAAAGAWRGVAVGGRGGDQGMPGVCAADARPRRGRRGRGRGARQWPMLASPPAPSPSHHHHPSPPDAKQAAQDAKRADAARQHAGLARALARLVPKGLRERYRPVAGGPGPGEADAADKKD
jgi:hypothetical protein